MACRGASGLESVDVALSLSPLDPLGYAMLSTRGLSHLIQGDYAHAAEWA